MCIRDSIWGRLDVHSPNITPLIRFKNVLKDDGSGSLPSYSPYPEGDGRMILGVDKKKRIVYVGDSQIFEIGSGNVVKRNSRIDNNVGDLTNDYSRIMEMCIRDSHNITQNTVRMFFFCHYNTFLTVTSLEYLVFLS